MHMGTSTPIESAQNIGKYTLFEKLGEGHLGPAYRGFNQDSGRPVVVRILCDGIRWDAKLEATFDECRAIADLKHSNIATIFEFGREGQNHYIAMESLGNGTLKNLIVRNPAISVERKLSIMIQVAEGLSYAHKKGILHRDLGPGKIHLTADGKVKIRDFSIAHVLMNYLPHPAVQWGVPIYLCPEQIQHKNCDERSDIFSAGTIFYELLTHVHPFDDRDSNKSLDNILSDAPIPTFEKFPDAPPGIWTILRSCLGKNPEERYRTMDEVSSACRELLKSLAGDTQLMLAELYASLPHLKKAAAQPAASEGTITLLQQIEKLLKGDTEADYTRLDQLMTILMEQYPAIQMAAEALSPLDSICLQPPMEEEDRLDSQSGSVFPGEISEPHDFLPETPVNTIAAPGPREAFPHFGIERQSTEPAESADSSPEPPRVQALPSEGPGAAEILPIMPAIPGGNEKSFDFRVPQSAPEYRWIPRLSYRSATALISMLLVAMAGCIFSETNAAASIRGAWHTCSFYAVMILHNFLPQLHTNPSKASAVPEAQSAQEIRQEPQKTNPSYEPAASALKVTKGSELSSVSRTSKPGRSLGESVSRISKPIDSVMLQSAKAEIERLEQTQPDAPALSGLHRLGQASYMKQQPESSAREEEQHKAAARQKEDGWNRQITEFLALGKYNEAAGPLTMWLSDNPGSTRAQELNARIQEIQRHLKGYMSAIAESRYSDALNAIGSAEKLNPADPNLAELHRQAEARKFAARALLSVHRLGAKAVLLLDGHPVGRDGEIENESIPIGSHTLAIENDGGLIASKIQEYPEGQHLVFVYDPVKQILQKMTDADRELLAQRKAMEEAESFPVEHDHGIFRASCNGVLSLNSLDVAYSPTLGTHGFRIPFKLLKLKAEGKSVSMYYISDNTHFQTFRFRDSQSAARFNQKWAELKALLN